MAPLSKLQNQARPSRRPAVYGKRRQANASITEMHRQLFGTNGNEIEYRMRGLTICAESQPKLEHAITAESKNKENEVRHPGSRHREGSSSKRKPKPVAKTDNEPSTHTIINPDTAQTLSTAPNSPSKTERDPNVNSTPTQRRRRFPRASRQQTDQNAQVEESRQTRKPPDRPRRRRKMAALTDFEKQRLNALLPLIESQKAVIDFDEYVFSQTHTRNIVKVGEGSFSEVFRFTETESPYQSSVFKIIPFDFETGDNLSNLDDVVREVKMLRLLMDQHGFTALRTFQIVRGAWPKVLLEAWNTFKDKSPRWAENESPALHSNDRLYGIIEMADAGTHLEELRHPSPYEIFDVFWKTAIFLARAEKDLEFEHRDLHMSNICFKSAASEVNHTSSDPILGRSGLEITVIDYTLARMKTEDEVIYHPSGIGNGSISKDQHAHASHQFRAIRRARDWCAQEHSRLLTAGGREEVGEKWALFAPKSNVIWLGHVLYQLLGRGVEVKEANTAADEVLQRSTGSILSEVLATIEAEALEDVPASADALVNTAMERAWLAESDVKAFIAELNGS